VSQVLVADGGCAGERGVCWRAVTRAVGFLVAGAVGSDGARRRMGVRRAGGSAWGRRNVPACRGVVHGKVGRITLRGADRASGARKQRRTCICSWLGSEAGRAWVCAAAHAGR